MQRNGTDVTAAFHREGDHLVGLVNGLQLGNNELTVTPNRNSSAPPHARLTLRNYPNEGPMFSGPHQEFFVCNTIQAGLGEPLVDNQQGKGFRVQNPDGTTAGYSVNCSANTQVDYQYRTTGGSFQPLPSRRLPPERHGADHAARRPHRRLRRAARARHDRPLHLLVRDARSVRRGARRRRPTPRSGTGGLIYSFDGGVAIGHDQGTPGGSASLYHIGLRKGYAIVHSSGTRTSTHYNLVLGGETALMTKEQFIERYGVPLYTVGVGGSGGGIQQYVYGQNYPGLIDAGIPQYSYPDMVTQTIHVGDCELLENFMDDTDGSQPEVAELEQPRLARGPERGLDTSPTPTGGRAPGNSECVKGWRGLTPLALNPLWFQSLQRARADGPGRDGEGAVEPRGDLLEHLRRRAGRLRAQHLRQRRRPVRAEGADRRQHHPGRVPRAERHGRQLEGGARHGPGGLPVPVATAADATGAAGSTRGAPATCGSAPTAARLRRRGATGDLIAMHDAYNRGLYFDGKIDIPLIDWRHYLEEQLDMHNSHQSFASRQRMRDHDGNACNQVIWFTDARPAGAFDQTPQAFEVMDQWMANIRANPQRGVAGNKPPLATDRCFTTAGTEIAARPERVGRHPQQPPRRHVHAAVPAHSTSRIVAGGPLRGGVYACALQSVTPRSRRAVRLVDAIGRRGRAAEADLPDRGLRLHQGGCRPALRLPVQP